MELRISKIAFYFPRNAERESSGACFTIQLKITTKISVDYKIFQNS